LPNNIMKKMECFNKASHQIIKTQLLINIKMT